MQSMPAYVSSITPLALLLPVNCRVENVLLQAFPLTTPVQEPETVDICGGNLAAEMHGSLAQV